MDGWTRPVTQSDSNGPRDKANVKRACTWGPCGNKAFCDFGNFHGHGGHTIIDKAASHTKILAHLQHLPSTIIRKKINNFNIFFNNNKTKQILAHMYMILFPISQWSDATVDLHTPQTPHVLLVSSGLLPLDSENERRRKLRKISILGESVRVNYWRFLFCGKCASFL